MATGRTLGRRFYFSQRSLAGGFNKKCSHPFLLDPLQSRNLSHGIQCPPSHSRQSTGPPSQAIGRPMIPLGVKLCVNLTFYMICWTIMHLPFCQEINFRANVSSIGAALKVCQELVQPFSWHRWLDERESKK